MPSTPTPSPLTRLAPASHIPCSAVAGEICAQVLTGAPIHAGAPEAGGGGCKDRRGHHRCVLPKDL